MTSFVKVSLMSKRVSIAAASVAAGCKKSLFMGSLFGFKLWNLNSKSAGLPSPAAQGV